MYVHHVLFCNTWKLHKHVGVWASVWADKEDAIKYDRGIYLDICMGKGSRKSSFV